VWGLDCIHVPPDVVQWLAPVNTVMNILPRREERKNERKKQKRKKTKRTKIEMNIIQENPGVTRNKKEREDK
jgi:hypothetical protein